MYRALERFTLIAFLTTALGAADIRFTGFSAGLALPATLNVAWSQTSSVDIRTGLGPGAIANFEIDRHKIGLLFSANKSSMLWQRIDGSQNGDICNEGYTRSFFAFPGPCDLLQVRLSPVYWFSQWFGDLGAGVSLVYNYFSNYTFKGAEVYNTKRSYEALGLVGAFKKNWRWFTLVVAVHFDYAILAQSPLINESVKSLQTGVIAYALFKLF